uniref:Zgc:162297 n=1 Tax=Oncorhynchus mykiss TaxID=8022 RepID=A0A8C7NFN2_ONCMY
MSFFTLFLFFNFDFYVFQAHLLEAWPQIIEEDGLIIENMHDVLYTFSIGPEVCASMTAVCAAGRGICPSLFRSCLQQTALDVALGVDFIRAEGYVFSSVADEGLLNACVGVLLRYGKQIKAEHVQIFTDIKKKHSSHVLTSDVSIVETARADPVELRDVAESVRLLVLIGSGVTHDNMEQYLDSIAMTIGSHFKRGGVWAYAVDPESVKKFMGKVRFLRK